MTDFAWLAVLVVDDDRMARDILQAMFTSLKFRDVAVCADGFEAIDRMQTAKFDLAVVDVQLGAENGLDLTRTLRRLDGGEAMRILIITAGRDHDTMIAAKHAGADGILLKPFTRAVLRERLEKLFAGHP